MIQKARPTRSEWRWAIGWSLVILFLSCLPYLIAGQLAPPGWQFAGFLVNPLDGHSYIAKMRQGYEGNWLFHLTYTPEPHQGAFIFLFYLALGRLAALTHLPLIWIFHLARLAAGLLLAMAAFRFIAQVTPHPAERRLAFLLLLTASGFGWLGAILGTFPIDLWVPEAFGPYSLYANPHFPLGMALMLIIFLPVIQPAPPSPRPNLRSILRTGLAGLALALILPFALLTVWAVLAIFLLWLYLSRRGLPWQQIWLTLGVGLFSAPVIAYDYWVSVSNPILAGWSRQNVTPAPAVLDLLLGYGLVGLLALVGGWIIIRRGWLDAPPGEGLVLLWAVTTIGLVYMPLDLQRRLINGLHIPLTLLAAIGLKRWLDRTTLNQRRRRLIGNAVVTVGGLGTLFVWGLPLLGMMSPPSESATTALFFLRNEEVAALDWLNENSQADDIILASPRLGMFVPGQTGARAFYGHPFETIEAETKKAMTEAFYRGEIQTVSPRPTFIFYGPSEQALGQPERLATYPTVFSTNHVEIYKVE